MKVIYVDDYKFVRDDETGYYRCNELRTRLHRYVYEKFNGVLPSNEDVHHIDGNKDNNNLSNLIALSRQDHAKLHGELLTDEQRKKRRENLTENARPAACAWHGSEDGREWHREHYARTKDALHKVESRNCRHCGAEFVSVRDGYCSNACKSAYRRAKGYDNITLVCPICGETYETNKYLQSETCSRSCANRLRWRRKHGQD